MLTDVRYLPAMRGFCAFFGLIQLCIPERRGPIDVRASRLLPGVFSLMLVKTLCPVVTRSCACIYEGDQHVAGSEYMRLADDGMPSSL